MLQLLNSTYQGSLSWWVHYWCCFVWSLAAITRILYDAASEKADDVPACGFKRVADQQQQMSRHLPSRLLSANLSHSPCSPRASVSACKWCPLRLSLPTDHRISSTSFHPLKCSSEGLELLISPVFIIYRHIFGNVRGVLTHQHLLLNPPRIFSILSFSIMDQRPMAV